MRTTEYTIIVHKACKSQLTRRMDGSVYCDVCNRVVRPEEVNEVDNSPSPFAG